MSQPPYQPYQGGDAPQPPQNPAPYGQDQSGYGQPAQPAYGQPAQPDAYGQPAQPAYGQPVQPAYGQMAPQAPPVASPPAAGQPYGAYPSQGQPYGSPYGGAAGYAPYAAPAGPQPLSWRTILAYVFSPIAVIFLPIVFGVLAIVFSALAVKRNEKTAKIALGVAIGCTALGFILGAVTAVQTMQQFG
ncbi:hypothetical protein V5D56_03730 [Cellulosimicrobium sp. PMB13]|uniref:hypothetical protein n=1 Tax=Cellulosimicrobium sp. PMB13 TaxID=3120158 RepID=UPI003F4B849C